MKRHQPLLLYQDILIEVLPFTDGSDWSHLEQASKVCQSICAESLHYIVSSWNSNFTGRVPPSMHSLLLKKELFKIFVYLTENPSLGWGMVDSSHRSLLDLSVEMKLYNFARVLVGKGIKSSTEAETMFECIRANDLLGCEILLSCGNPIDRFRSRDDGLNVLTCSVLFASCDLVDLFLSRGVSVPNGILIEAIQSRSAQLEVVPLVSLLLSKGHCDPNSVSMLGVPALQVAILFSPFAHQLAKVLVAAGAHPNGRDGSEGGGLSALDAARRKRTCYEFLKSVGAKHSFKFCVESGQIANFPASLDLDPNTFHYLLSLAAAMGRVESLKALLQLQPSTDLNTVLIREDISLLHLAACRGHYAVCRYLIRTQINVSARAFGGLDIHVFAAHLAGSPLWSDALPGSLLPPVARLKTAAELAREAGHDRLGKLIDFSVVESVIARRDSESSWASSPRNSPGSTSPNWSAESSPVGTFVLQGL